MLIETNALYAIWIMLMEIPLEEGDVGVYLKTVLMEVASSECLCLGKVLRSSFVLPAPLTRMSVLGIIAISTKRFRESLRFRG